MLTRFLYLVIRTEREAMGSASLPPELLQTPWIDTIMPKSFGFRNTNRLFLLAKPCIQSILTMASFPCVACSEEVRPRQHAFKCDECDQWQHRTCNTGISQDDYRRIIRGELMVNEPWFCPECSQSNATGTSVYQVLSSIFYIYW